MNKKSLLLAVFAAVGLSANAQQILKIGFESDEPKGVYTTADSTQFAGFFADHINLQEDDMWNEQGTDAHSGEYALEVDNTNTYKGNPWDRGFKIRNIKLEDNTSYRVSYWVKADPQYEASDGSRGNTSIKNSLSIGFEQVEAPTVAPSGSEYYFNYTSGMTGEWRHIRNVTFFTNKELQDKYFSNYNKNIKEITENGDTIFYSDGMTAFAEQYFITINMYNPGLYSIDDIVLEKSTIAGTSFNDYAIRIDFGYPTNIASLAKTDGGTLVLDPSQVTLKIGDQTYNPEFLEGKPDGYLYAFVSEDLVLEDTEVIEVSFTPAADCPILYTNEKRPSADIESEMQVLPFSGEIADWDETIEQIPSAWEAPELVSTIPENESFELKASDVANVYFYYNKAIDLSTASVVLYSNGKSTDLTKFMNLTSDGKGIVCGTGAPLADGEYIIQVSGVQSSYGETCTEDQELSFQVGVDSDTSESEVVYASDFDNEMTGGVPQGWTTWNEAGFHLYGFNDDGSQYNYNWGGNPGGGGTRLYDGFSGDFVKAMYWGSRGTTEGYATYGEQVKDYMLEGGAIDPNMPEGIALKLDARKYQISFLMAAWKGEPTFTFTLEDLQGNVYAQFTDILAAPNVNGATGKVTGSVSCVKDFTTSTPGYYVLRFTAAEAQWQEYLLANVKVITMPSKAAYYKQQLNVALEAAKAVLADAEDAVYNGDTKTALINEIATAEAGGFTAPSQVQAEIDKLQAIAEALTTRIKNIDDFNIAKDEAEIAMAELTGTKYENTEAYQTASGIMSQYGSTNPTDLSDEVLAEVAPTLTNAAAQLSKVKGCSDLLTWGLYKATQTAGIIGTVAEDELNAAYNATTDDRDVAKALNHANKMRIYELIINGEFTDAVMTELYDNLNADSLVTKGIEFTGAIQNPKFYREYGKDGFPGWTITGNTPGFAGSAPTAIEYVTSSGISSWGNNNYDMSQTLEDLPVGIYAVEIDTRTPDNCKAINGYGYNAQNDETGVWDMYSYAQGDGDEAQSVRPYRAAGSGSSPVGVIDGIQVKEGTLTFGVHEQYVSGKAMDSTGNPTDFWTGTSQVGNARLFFVAPLPGFDYATSIENLKADVELNAVRKEFFTVSGVRTATAQKGINIVKMYDAQGNSITKKMMVK